MARPSLHLLLLALIGYALAAALPATTPCADIGSACTCEGTTPDAEKNVYLCDDKRLGPAQVYAADAPRAVTVSWKRLGSLCPGAFLQKYVEGKGFRYPPLEGFALDARGQPMRNVTTLEPGTLIDRFGGEGGAYVSPVGIPYEQRSLPPSSLVPYPKDPHPFNYYVYRVAKPFEVAAGPIAPWFEQPGGGVQFKLSKSVGDYIKSGYLERVAASCQSNAAKCEVLKSR